MATDAQIKRIKYLRGNGLSQKDIADDVSLSPQMVSVILKQLANEFNESKPVRIIVTKGFEPKDTVIEFDTQDFENFRESETIYGTEKSIFEIRQGLVHKTSFNDLVPVEFYPQIADLLTKFQLPEMLYQKKEIKHEFQMRLENRFGNFYRKKYQHKPGMTWLAQYYIEPEGIDLRSVGDVVFIELCNIMADYSHSVLQKLSDGYLEDMPDEDQVQLIRFHMEKEAKFDDNKKWEHEYLESNWDKYPFLIGMILGEGELKKRYNEDAEIMVRQDFMSFLSDVLSSISLSVDDLQKALNYNTLDVDLIQKFETTGAKTIEVLQEIEQRGVSNVEELKASYAAFNNRKIVLSEYPSIGKETTRSIKKLKEAVKRGDIDDALLHAFARFESKAKILWNENRILRPILSKADVQISVRPGEDPDAKILVDLFSHGLSDVQELRKFCNEARIIRNEILHEDKISNKLVTRHVLDILQLTELIIQKLEDNNINFKQRLLDKGESENEDLIFDGENCPKCGMEWEGHAMCEWCGWELKE
tara:strand:- start:18282 stop:19877 length:1596 start_codon:yes stop_codon:yes gene_type:complete